MAPMCPACTLPTAPHGLSACYQPLILQQASADVVQQAGILWTVHNHPRYLFCPICHYSEALLAPQLEDRPGRSENLRARRGLSKPQEEFDV